MLPASPHLTPSQKLATASHLYWGARQLKSSALRRLHPDWDNLRIEREVRLIFLLSPGLSRDVNLFALILRPLESAGLDYMVSGSVAAMTSPRHFTMIVSASSDSFIARF